MGGAETPYSHRCVLNLHDFTPKGVSVGIHLMAWLPQDLHDAELVSAALRVSVQLT